MNSDDIVTFLSSDLYICDLSVNLNDNLMGWNIFKVNYLSIIIY